MGDDIMNIKFHLEDLDEDSRRIFQIAYPDYDDRKYEAISWSQEKEMTALQRLRFIPKHTKEIMTEMIRLKKEFEEQNKRVKNGSLEIYHSNVDKEAALEAIAIVEERARQQELEER